MKANPVREKVTFFVTFGISRSSFEKGHGFLMGLSLEEEEAIRAQIAELKHQHRDLDYLTQVMEEQNSNDQLSIRRMKKRKLEIKDQIARLESNLIPDILA